MSQTRYAYLFGANGPVETQLQYAEKDVQRLSSALQEPRYGFITRAVTATSRDDVLEGLEEYTARCGASDLLLVHFSGHAVYKGHLYLLCNQSNTNSLIRSAVDIRDIKTFLQSPNCKARQKVLILDCCHAGAAHAGGPYKEKGDDENGIRAALQDTAQGSASLIFSACSQRHTTRELATLDGGSGFLSWLIRAACTDRFKDVSSDQISLSLDDIDRWVPTALAEVNATLSGEHQLPLPLFFGEWESGSGRNIWFTNPPDSGSTRRSNPDADRAKYLRHVSTLYNAVTLPIGPTQGFSLHAIFQPLALRSDPLMLTDGRKKRRSLLGEASADDEATSSLDSRDRHEKQRSGERDQASFAQKKIVEQSEDALQQSPQGRIIILGGPGTGKTTTLKHLVGSRAEVALTDPGAPLPLYISLPALARSGKTLQSYLIDLVEKMGIEKSYAELLWQAIAHGHAFVVLDGLDEVDPRQRADIVDQINYYASEPGNTWLVGSRFSEYKGGQFTRGQFCEWELLPMTPERRRSLVDRLFPELYRLFDVASSDPASSATFVQLLENHAQAAAWGENPLLLSLAAVIYVRTGDLPQSRAELYHDVIAAILSTRASSELERAHLLQEFMDLALWLYQRRGRLFTTHDLLDFLKKEQHYSFQEVSDIAHLMISSGILDPVAQDTYGFRHQTFLEYLVGSALALRLTDHRQSVRDEAWALAWSKRTYSRWTEILRLMVGALVQLPERKGIDKARHWLEALSAQRTSEEGDPGQLGLALVLESLAEVTAREAWRNAESMQFGRQVLDVWLDALFVAARREQSGRIRHLETLSVSIGTLFNDDAVLVRLVDGLKDRDSHVRQTASNILSRAGRSITPAFLVGLLQDSTETVRAAVVEVLGKLGERVPIEVLMGALSDNAWEVRAAAVKALGEQGERVPLEVVVRALNDSNNDVRVAAVEALGKQGKRVPLEVLIGALSDSNSYVRTAVLEALGEQGERVPLEVLMGAFSDNAWEVRVVAVRVLGKQGERVPLKVLVGALSNNDKYMRVAVVEALGRQGGSVPLEVLVGALSDSAWDVRAAVVEALGEQGERVPIEVVMRALNDSANEVRAAAVRVLGKQGERMPIEVLVGALSDSNNEVRAAVVEALERQGERIPLEALVEALSDSTGAVRKAAVEVLGKLGERVPIEIVMEALSDSNTDVRAAAVRVLGEQGERVPLEVLMGALSDKDNYVREAAVRVLGKLGERMPLEIVVGALSDSNTDVRVAAVEALGEQRERVPLEVLMGALSDNDNYMRVAAVKALVEQGERVPPEVLMGALSDNDTDVRVVVVEALGEQRERVPPEVLMGALSDNAWEVRMAVVEALGKLGERVPLEVLIGALSDNDNYVRAAAVRVLGEQGERVPLEVLVGALSDNDNEVRAAAVRVLGEQGERVPIEVLIGALSDSTGAVRAAAVEALGKLGERVPIEVLMGVLSDNECEVRVTVIKALGEQGERMPLEIVVGALSDNDWDVRVAAVIALGKQGERVPIEVLMGTLSDNENYVRAVAVDILQQRSPETLSPLISEAIAILRKQPAGYVLGSLIQGSFLDIIKSTGYRAPLILARVTELLDWPYWQVRMNAAETLGELRRNIPDAAIRRLLELRRDPDPLMKSVREAADDALAEILSLEDGIEDD